MNAPANVKVLRQYDSDQALVMWDSLVVGGVTITYSVDISAVSSELGFKNYANSLAAQSGSMQCLAVTLPDKNAVCYVKVTASGTPGGLESHTVAFSGL